MSDLERLVANINRAEGALRFYRRLQASGLSLLPGAVSAHVDRLQAYVNNRRSHHSGILRKRAKGWQAKWISDEQIYEAIRAVNAANATTGANRWDIHKRLVPIPDKVIDAKLRSMVERNLIDGCACRHNCRGDFSIGPRW